MKQIRCTAYGPPETLRLEEVETPEPGKDDVLVRVHASTVTAGDCELRRGQVAVLFWLPLRLMFGVLRPRNLVLGQDFSGVVEKTGENVTGLQPGDEVFGTTRVRFGGHAEYACLPAKYSIVAKPAELSHAEAASIPVGGYNALDFLREAKVGEGHHVLINGACGTIGTMAVQLAKHFGATVTAIDTAGKLQTLRDIGADHVIDPAQEDFRKNGVLYDAIIDLVWRKPVAIDSVKDGGHYIIGNPAATETLKGKRTRKKNGKTIVPALAADTSEDLVMLAGLASDGVLKPVVDRIYPLEDAADAHRFVESGEKLGNVVLRVD